ncbi:hypothetical protein Fmac_004928 [Flemingia macrophylla]|uniref:NADH dehydrogenase subunit 5 n=1 Tax=Flemingia macrophylla TaxID=520843 RepID=A0ABD1N6M5_9FABA
MLSSLISPSTLKLVLLFQLIYLIVSCYSPSNIGYHHKPFANQHTDEKHYPLLSTLANLVTILPPSTLLPSTSNLYYPTVQKSLTIVSINNIFFCYTIILSSIIINLLFSFQM